MRWYALVSLMSDGRIKFLIWFAAIAVILAVILTLVELRLKKKKKKQDVKIVDESGIEKMQRFLKQDKMPREKLDFVDKAAKEYFREAHGTSLSSSYSLLVEELEKHRLVHKNKIPKKGASAEILFSPGNEEISFCKAMFATYYSREELTDDKVITLGKMLVNIKKDRKRAEEIFYVPSFNEEIGGLFRKIKKIIFEKVQEYIEKRHRNKLRQQGITKRRYELQVVKEKARIAHSRKVAIARAQKIKNIKRVIIKLFCKISQTISNKVQERKERVYRNKLRQQRIAKRRYELQILDEKARIAHSRKVAIARAQKIKNIKRVIIKLFCKISQTISNKVQERKERVYRNKLRQQRIAKRRYELQVVRERAKMIRSQRIAIARAQKIKRAKKMVKELTFSWIKNLTNLGINQIQKVRRLIIAAKKKKKIILAKEKAAVVQIQKVGVRVAQKVKEKKKSLEGKGVQSWKDKIIDSVKNVKKILFRKKIEKINQENFYRNIVSERSGSDEFKNNLKIKKEGVAERIVRSEKNRLKQIDAFSM